MGIEFLAVLLGGAFAGGVINGLAGFGTALFALGFWLQVLPAAQAVAMVVVMSVVSGLQGLWIVRGEIRRNPGRLARFLLPALLGIPLGVALLSVVSATLLKIVIAGFMLLYGGFFLLRRSLPRFERSTPVLDSLVGFAGGVLGGAASLSGALPTMWCAMRPWPKGETRAVLQPFNVVVLALTAVLFLLNGLYTSDTLVLMAIALPVTMIGAQLGLSVFRRLGDEQFRVLLIGLMFASGAILGLREIM